MKFAQARRPDPVIDITPMIDVVFQLVLFFMVSTTFTNAPGIQVELPKAASDVVLSDKQDLNIWVTSTGEVFVDEAPVDMQGLQQRLTAAAERDPDTLVVIKADQGVNHGRVVTVMDIARSKGLSRLAIATEGDEARP